MKSVARSGPEAERPLSRQFRLLWAGSSISLLGDRVTVVALPTLAVYTLGASAFEVGLITTAQYAATPVLGLLAGALADRWDRRRLLIFCDLVRVVAMAVIPFAWWFGHLSLATLMVCVVVASAATVFSNIGISAALPAVVEARDVVRANSRLETSRTVSEVSGPALAGGIYHALGVWSLLIDACTFLFSAGTLAAMRPFGGRTSRGERLWPRLGLGVRVIRKDPVLVRCALGTLMANAGGSIYFTVYPLLAYQGLHLSVAAFGAAQSVAAVGAVAGALIASRVTDRLGAGRVMAWTAVAEPVCVLGVLLAPVLPAMLVLSVSGAFAGFFQALYNVNSISVRQVRVPDEEQSAMHAAYRTLAWGIVPVGAFCGGAAVSALTGPLGALGAVQAVIAAAAVLSMSAALPLSGIQRCLDRERAMADAPPDDENKARAAARTDGT